MISRPDARGGYITKSWVDWLIEDYGLKELDPDSKALFASEMVKAEIELLKIRLEKLKGNYDTRHLNEAMEALGVQAQASVQQGASQEALFSITLQQLADEYWGEKEATWKPRSVTEYQRIRDHFIEHLGADALAAGLKYDDLKAYRQTMIDDGKSVSTINKALNHV